MTGREAYETELKVFPNYEDGKPRKAWDQLPDYAKASWDRDPTPRIKVKA
jgi:hypothetical protein